MWVTGICWDQSCLDAQVPMNGQHLVIFMFSEKAPVIIAGHGVYYIETPAFSSEFRGSVILSDFFTKLTIAVYPVTSKT